MSYRYQTYWHLKDLKAAHQSFWGPGPLLKATTWAFIDGTPHPLVISPGKLRYVSITIMWCPKKLQVDFKTFFDYKKVYLPYTNILRFQSGAPPAGIIHACPWWACRITSLYKWCQKTRTIAQLGSSRNCGKKKVMDGLFHGKSQSHSWMIAWGCLGYGTPPHFRKPPIIPQATSFIHWPGLLPGSDATITANAKSLCWPPRTMRSSSKARVFQVSKEKLLTCDVYINSIYIYISSIYK